MAPVIGPANEFYRLRVTRVDVTSEPEFEWREDILYRKPPQELPEEREAWTVEAVSLDDEDDVMALESFENQADAYDFLESAEHDLEELTKTQFEERHFPSA